MAKQHITDETILDKCTNESCPYNRQNFCDIHSIMIDDTGKCIYAANKEVKHE